MGKNLLIWTTCLCGSGQLQSGRAVTVGVCLTMKIGGRQDCRLLLNPASNENFPAAP